MLSSECSNNKVEKAHNQLTMCAQQSLNERKNPTYKSDNRVLVLLIKLTLVSFTRASEIRERSGREARSGRCLRQS